jgi:hypothetical protein
MFGAPSFWTWRAIAKLIDGAPLTEPRELSLFKECSGLDYNRDNRRKIRRLSKERCGQDDGNLGTSGLAVDTRSTRMTHNGPRPPSPTANEL